MVEPGGGYLLLAPDEAVPLGPLPIRQGAWSAGEFGVCPHEAQTDVLVRVLRLNGQHLAAILWCEQAFGFNHHAIGQDKVRRVLGSDGVGKGLAFVVEGQAPFVQ